MHNDFTNKLEVPKTGTLLSKEQNFINILVQASPALYVVIDPKGNTLFMNDSMLTSLGYDLEEVFGRDYVSTFVPDEERIPLSQILDKLMKTKEPTIAKNNILTKDGREVLVEWHGRSLFDDNGNFEFFLGMGVDISDRKKMEEEIEDREKTLNGIFAAAPIGINLMKDRRVVWCNLRMSDITGYSIEEIIGNDAKLFYETEEEYIKLKDMLYPHDIEEYPLEETANWKKKDGELIQVSIRVSPYNDKDLSQGFITTVSDITKEKEAKRSLKERERTLNSILTAAPVGIKLVLNRQIIWCNKKMTDITGYTTEELTNRNLRFLYYDEEEYLRVGQKLYEKSSSEDFKNIETIWKTKDGHLINCYIGISPINALDYNEGMIEVVMNITDRKKSQIQLGENLEYFAHLVDHIRNPLAIMSGFIQVEVKNEKTKDRLMRQINRIEALIKQLDQGWMDTENTRTYLEKYL
jgi:PAS domain S-box-containing protein